ncbi:hypothetical protein Ssi02_49270 [Sinosporangium siamense]|uniref:Uncharacterized protein n=1 Tax=Sinosporangium siamense TaxID=1367973 RepID=A0A919V8X3_9ACTN|nr:hypothetical protein Ssi02_49270 [Sinosporangium siamense]
MRDLCHIAEKADDVAEHPLSLRDRDPAIVSDPTVKLSTGYHIAGGGQALYENPFGQSSETECLSIGAQSV